MDIVSFPSPPPSNLPNREEGNAGRRPPTNTKTNNNGRRSLRPRAAGGAGRSGTSRGRAGLGRAACQGHWRAGRPQRPLTPATRLGKAARELGPRERLGEGIQPAVQLTGTALHEPRGRRTAGQERTKARLRAAANPHGRHAVEKRRPARRTQRLTCNRAGPGPSPSAAGSPAGQCQDRDPAGYEALEEPPGPVPAPTHSRTKFWGTGAALSARPGAVDAASRNRTKPASFVRPARLPHRAAETRRCLLASCRCPEAASLSARSGPPASADRRTVQLGTDRVVRTEAHTELRKAINLVLPAARK